MPVLTFRDIPHEMLDHPKLPVAARFIYVRLWGSPGYTMRWLCGATGYEHHAVRAHCDLLQKAGWLSIERRRRGCMVFPMIPRDVQERMAADFAGFLDLSAYAGQATTRGWCDCLVAGLDFLDNFRPDFLRNPRTGQAMEYDFYNPQRRLAIEYNGPQHYKPTLWFPDLKEHQDQRTRDLIKQGLSVEHGIRLITIEAKDLTLDGMLAKLEGLPLKRYDASGPCIRVLGKVGQKLAKAAERLEQRLAAEGQDRR